MFCHVSLPIMSFLFILKISLALRWLSISEAEEGITDKAAISLARSLMIVFKLLLLTCRGEYLTLLTGHILLWCDCKKHSLWNLTCIFLMLILKFFFMILDWLRVFDEGLKITLEVSIKHYFRLNVVLTRPVLNRNTAYSFTCVVIVDQRIINNHLFK